MRRGINLPADLRANGKTIVRKNLSVCPIVRQGLKTPVS
jgi:hypothetical protein